MWLIFINNSNFTNYINIIIGVPNQVCKLIKLGKVRNVTSKNTTFILVIMYSQLTSIKLTYVGERGHFIMVKCEGSYKIQIWRNILHNLMLKGY